jgi:hypothetical protein
MKEFQVTCSQTQRLSPNLPLPYNFQLPLHLLPPNTKKVYGVRKEKGDAEQLSGHARQEKESKRLEGWTELLLNQKQK